MGSRLILHEMLCNILGSRNVYFQPPASVKMLYPAIVYSRRSIDNVYASDSVYDQHDSYEITYIGEDPDDETVRYISKLPHCKYDRHFASDNLHHDVFVLYF